MGILMQAFRRNPREKRHEIKWGTIAEVSPVSPRRSVRARAAAIAPVIGLTAMFFSVMTNTAWAAANPGDPLFCQPNEGVEFLIVNGGAGVFTSDADCYNNNYANDTDTTIATSGGGVLTRAAGTGNYVYTPPTPTFVGTDTFPISVTTVWNSAGGTGSAGGASRPGGLATLTITLNVIPSTTTLSVLGVPTLVPVPAGSITGCTVGGNAGQGPAAGSIHGCVTRVVATGATAPSHGTLSPSGNTIQYTPAANYSGSDTFSYRVLGTNTDGSTALNSGDVTVQVTVTQPVPALGTWAMAILCGLLLLFGMKVLLRRTA